jgi:hypothetical protein
VTLRDPGPQDPITAVIDLLAERATDALASNFRRARMRLRERDPVARLGLDIILGAQREMIATRALETLERISAVLAGKWWLAPGVRLDDGGDGAHVVAAGGRIALIQARYAWNGRVADADLGASSLLALVDDEDLDVVAIVSVADELPEPGWVRAASGRPIAVTPTERLSEIVERDLDGLGDYDPGLHPRLSRALHGARVREQQRAAALTTLVGELEPKRWLIAHGVRLPGLRRPIGVLVAGPTGIYVCEAAGIDPHRAATDATSAARHLARNGRGMRADVIPVVLSEPAVDAHQLELADGGRAWVLPLDRAATHIRAADRAGLRRHHLRRLRKPAPGWEYQIAPTEAGWSYEYEIRYDFSRHDRSQALGS